MRRTESTVNFVADNRFFGFVLYFALLLACSYCTWAQSAPFELKIEQVTTGQKHHFFGYIGQCQTIPWNADGRYILGLEIDRIDRLPTAQEFATVILVIVGLLWLPFIGLISSQLFVYLQSVQAYIAPPIAAVFLLGLLWKRANGRGALTALLVGFGIGAARFVGELLVNSGTVTSKTVVDLVEINFLHFALILFIISVFVQVFVSKMTAKPTAEELSIFNMSEHHVASMAHRKNTYKTDIVLSVILVIIILTFWLIFSPIFF